MLYPSATLDRFHISLLLINLLSEAHNTGVSFSLLQSRIPSANADLDAQSTFDLYNVNTQSVKKDGLMDGTRQSKLSQEQLTELQRSTHFDKKELQQWYKGMNVNLC